MPEVKHYASSRVTLTVEVAVGSSWGGDCSIKQVHDQATIEATNHLNNMIIKYSSEARIKIVGTPKVDAVIVTRT